MISHSRRPSFVPALGLVALALVGCPEPVCVDCFDNEGYRMDLSRLPAGTDPPAAVLFSGWRNGYCQNDVVCTGTPDVFLGDVRWGAVQWSRDCNPKDQEVIVFAGNHEPFVATPQIPPGEGIRLSDAVTSASFTAPLKIPVKIWVVGNPDLAGAAWLSQVADNTESATSESTTAHRIFLDEGTGLDLDITVDSFHSAGFPATGSLYNYAWCSDMVDLLNDHPPGYDRTKINVYYVGGLTGGWAGMTCDGAGSEGSGKNIIFIQAHRYQAMQLGHELGHALGLLRSADVPGNILPADFGHITDEMQLDEYLATNNLMRSGGDELRHLTLGQIYRMHYDKLSWRWSAPEAPAASDDYPRECQNSPVAGGDCPPLTLHPARGW